MRQEIEEAEREQRELEEAELGQLTLEKERLEEEVHVEQQHVEVLHGLERAVEWKQAALVASPPEAGLSWAPPQKPEQTMKGADRRPGIVIPEKNCTHCVMRETLCWWDPEGHARSCRLC